MALRNRELHARNDDDDIYVSIPFNLGRHIGLSLKGFMVMISIHKLSVHDA